MSRAGAKPLAIYVHTPFCPSKCGYCDFNSYAMEGEIIERTVRAMVDEIRRSPHRGRPAKTIFFGGGTPTFLSEAQLLRILEAVLEVHPPIAGAEITSEANPGTVDMPKFRAMRQAGFNRISLGAQSFVGDDLIRLGRVHAAGDIERAVGAAREAGFESLNLDLMFALPNQTMRAWEANLTRAMALQPDHLSLYCLTIEPNTAYYKLHLRGQLELPDEEAQVAMYDQCRVVCAEAGLMQYEISNYAKPGFECLHNIEYWEANEYAGYGPGAVGCVELDGVRRRQTNLKHPDGYSAAVEAEKGLAFESEVVTPAMHQTERIMMGLRLNRGIEDTGLDASVISQLVGRGWLTHAEGRVALTAEGRHFHNEVVVELMPEG